MSNSIIKTYQVLNILLIFSISAINCKLKKNSPKIKPFQDVEFLFVHGFGRNKEQLIHFQNHNIIPKPHKGIAFDGPEVSYGKFPNLSKTAMGQEKDIEIITQAMKMINKPIVAIGVSKGGATLINAAACPENIDKFKALVIESAFCDATDVIHNLFFFNLIPGGQFITKKLLKQILGNYNPDGIQPINSIKKIKNKQLPILLIHSQADKIVPVEHSRRLYNSFIENNFKNVHLVETESGIHANLVNKPSIQKIVNAFYKKYKIYHDLKLTNDLLLYSFETVD